MADDLASYEIFWTKDEQDMDIINSRGNRRPLAPTKMQATQNLNGVSGSSNKSKSNTVNHHQTPVKDEKSSNKLHKTVKPKKDSKKEISTPLVEVKKKPSLKDLRPEDKKRVANLIKELAKAGEEKEVAVEQLQVERLEFEHRMKDLHHQMNMLSQERETVQQQYLECQKLLADYQKQLAEDQEKISGMSEQMAAAAAAKTLHTSTRLPPHQDVLDPRPSKPTHPQQNPSKSYLAHQPSLHPDSLQPDTHYHQPFLNGYPPPPPDGYQSHSIPPPHNGYQPLNWNGQSDEPEEQWHVPVRYEDERNGVTLNRHPTSGRTDVANGDDDFQPIMSSTQRPSSKHQPSRRKAQHSDDAVNRHVARQSYAAVSGEDHTTRTSSLSHMFPSTSPDFTMNGRHSRTNSGEFKPLQPEPDYDSESGAAAGLDQNGEYAPFHFDPRPNNRTWHGHNDIPAQTNPVPSQSFHSMGPQQRHQELLKHRAQLEQEQAWLHQKLEEQNELLARKQAQLTETERLYLRTGDQSYNAKAPDVHINSKNYKGMHIDPPPVQRHIFGILPGTKGSDQISTNFPPEGFDEFGHPRLLTQPMHELGLGHMTSQSAHHAVNNYANHSSLPSSSSSKQTQQKRSPEREHLLRGKSPATDRVSHLHREKSPANTTSRHDDHIGGYASLHSSGKRKHRGSLSSSPSNTSTSSSNHHNRASSNARNHGATNARSSSSSSSRHPDATSPLYRDSRTSPRLSLSPGKVHVTMAPRRNGYNRSSSSQDSSIRHQQLQGNISLSSRSQRNSPSKILTPKRNTTLQLTDLIDSLDSTSISRNSPSQSHNGSHTHRVQSRDSYHHNGSRTSRTSFDRIIAPETHLSQSQNRYHQNGSRPSRTSYNGVISPELFSVDNTSSEVEQQESRMLEEVFFVV